MLTLLLALALSIGGSQAGVRARDAEAIAAAKNTSAHRLDPSLPEKSLAQWLRDVVGPHTPIAWEVNDCGEQTGNPIADKGRDFPTCAEAQVALPGKRTLYVSFSVGTVKTGVRAASVQFAYAVIVQPAGSAKPISKLSQVPEAIKAAP